MDSHGNFYELTEAQQKAMAGDGYEGKKIDGVVYERLREDVARLDGYLKARVEIDAPKRGKGANKDLAG
jgi:hypothetical protein